MVRQSGKQVFRVSGCPVSVAEYVLSIATLGRTKNPYLDGEVFVRFTYFYIIFNVVRFFHVTLGGLFRRQKRA